MLETGGNAAQFSREIFCYQSMFSIYCVRNSATLRHSAFLLDASANVLDFSIETW